MYCNGVGKPTPIYSSCYDGRNRWLWPSVCEVCGKTYYVPKNRLEKRHYCSRKCAASKAMVERVPLECAWCGKEFKRTRARMKNSRSGIYFCGNSCQNEARSLGSGGIREIQPPHYGTSYSPKGMVVRLRGWKCERCGTSEWYGSPVPLALHHVNGNPYDAELSNLQLLCYNCHGQTPNFCSKNRGRGRKSRGRPMGLAPGSANQG